MIVQFRRPISTSKTSLQAYFDFKFCLSQSKPEFNFEGVVHVMKRVVYVMKGVVRVTAP